MNHITKNEGNSHRTEQNKRSKQTDKEKLPHILRQNSLAECFSIWTVILK